MAQSLKSLPIGSLVKFGKLYDTPIVWRIADVNHAGYPSNSVALVSKDIIKIMAFDAKEPYSANPDIADGGHALWGPSNIRYWANSDGTAGNWYLQAQSDTDMAPSSKYVQDNPYEKEPGFLNEFSEEEKAALLKVDHRVGVNFYHGESRTYTDKIWIPSETEFNCDSGYCYTAGTAYKLFVNKPELIRAPAITKEAANHFANTNWTPKAGGYVTFWTSTMQWRSETLVQCIGNNRGTTTLYNNYAYQSYGFVPACALSGDTFVSDSTDSDGCYTVRFNSAPSTTGTLTVPQKIEAGTSCTISWGKAEDADGNLSGYILEVKADNKTWDQLYKGSARTVTYEVADGISTLAFRVKAYDTYGAESAYITSNTIDVHNNQPPEIVLNASDLGELSMTPPTFEYTVTDPDNDEVTVSELVDGKVKKTYVVNLGTNNTFTLEQSDWNKVLNGTHTITIKATDSKGASVSGSIPFSKKVTKIQFTKAKPEDCAEMPTEAIFTVGYNAPTGAALKVEACNNGYDVELAWEDVTEAFQNGSVYTFTNRTKTADKWGLNCRYTIEKGGATSTCYIESAGGNFE